MQPALKSDQYIVKILVVGNCGVGKTAIVNRLIYNNFEKSYKATVGVDFAFRTFTVTRANGTIAHVRAQLWDVGGQEKASQLTSAYFKDALGCLVVGDLGDEGLISGIAEWFRELREKARMPRDYEKLPCVFLCNKVDLEENRQVYTAELEKQLKAMGAEMVLPSSALTGENLSMAMDHLLRKAVEYLDTAATRKDSAVISNLNIAHEKGCCK